LFPRFQPESVQKEIDPGFVNDQYWLVFPFHVYWDAGADVQDRGMTKLPLGKGTGRHVVVKFAGGGYTPGDTWELYLGSDDRVKERHRVLDARRAPDRLRPCRRRR
jgi:hypothetical protein